MARLNNHPEHNHPERNHGQRILKVGLNGFGRVGRSLLRQIYAREDIEVVAIVDPADPEVLEYLLRFDTLLGRFPEPLSVREGHLYVAGRQIVLRQIEPGATGDQGTDWGALGVDLVVESGAGVRSRALLEGHLAAGARRVLLCSPPQEPPDITIVVGINDDDLAPEHRIVSNGSSTAHCAAPVLAILGRAFGVERAYLSSVHAYTSQQNLADVPDQDPRRGRAASENIIPLQANSGELLELVLPELAGRITASAINVPVPNGSVVDLVCWHQRPVTPVAINEVMRTAAGTERWRRILAFEDAPLVSSDVVRSAYSAIFDADATMVLGERVSKTLCWYDNTWGYVARAVDLMERIAALEALPETRP
jgi:glyceraldehyde 3-phosphate dehydrogenase